MKDIYIITGGTMVHVTPHFSLCAPAYGNVGFEIFERMTTALVQNGLDNDYRVFLVKTKMAGQNSEITETQFKQLDYQSKLETNRDLELLVQTILGQPETASIVMAAAICDFAPEELTGFEDKDPITVTEFGKDKKRLHKAHSLNLKLSPSKKIIDVIKTERPEVLLVTFKTTAGADEAELIAKSWRNLKRSSSDLVFGNDIQTRVNRVVSETAVFHADTRQAALDTLCVEMLKRLG